MAQDVMTADQAAKYLQTSRDTLLRKARQGTIPAAKVGREWRFSREDLHAWIQAGGDWEEAMVIRGMAMELAERMADPANQETRPLDEVLQEMGL
jgi:excisionase family DNA binding protein